MTASNTCFLLVLLEHTSDADRIGDGCFGSHGPQEHFRAVRSRACTSIFADDLDNLISLKVSLGYSESTYLGRARQFDRYCSMKYEKGPQV